MPGMRMTSSPRMKGRSRSGRTTHRPSGLQISEAILATNIDGATPAEAVRPVAAKILLLIPRAMRVALRSLILFSVTSR